MGHVWGESERNPLLIFVIFLFRVFDHQIAPVHSFFSLSISVSMRTRMHLSMNFNNINCIYVCVCAGYSGWQQRQQRLPPTGSAANSLSSSECYSHANKLAPTTRYQPIRSGKPKKRQSPCKFCSAD